MKKIIALTSVIATLLLSGCSQVGAAATVGNTKISQATVQASIDSILAERAKIDTSQMQLEIGEDLNRSQLRLHLLSQILNDVSKKVKMTVSKAEIDTRRASILEQVGGVEKLPTALVGAGISPLDFDLYLQSIIISDKLSQALTASGVAEADIGTQIQKLVVDMANEEKVVVNPRYGVWDAVNANIVATDAAGSAVTPATK
ncbi:unannotated protein [freshwater metagenome]|uniref:Unannotated protein n=1 Tax=freshwater metagenome TaxID=449393 RepID=A0A6J7XSW8_9ZZZZ|nr:hypothetical protein [Actinomycetota bacterium]